MLVKLPAASLTSLSFMGNCYSAQVKAESPSISPESAASPTHNKSSPRNNESLSQDYVSQPSPRLACGTLRAFSYSDLRAATRNFRPDSLLGEGGFGRVFKGYIDEHTFLPTRAGQGVMIAVKKLNLDGLQGHQEWLAEVHFLGALHHPNLVKLIGFCAEDDNRLLVYEFMPRGSLENHLFRKGNHYQTLSWTVRMQIAIDAARGLTFLHDAERPVIYRDFKASNILLDSNYNAKLSDFGLAKDGPTGDNTHVSTRVMGTYGYAAPEYVATGHLTAKSDVYSFGVVLLELLTGRKAVDRNRPPAEQNLVEWVKPYLSEKSEVLHIIDERLQRQYPSRGAQKAAYVAQYCLNPDAKLRPTMKQVLHSLESLLDARDLPKYAESLDQRDQSGSKGSKAGGHQNGVTSHHHIKRRGHYADRQQ